MEEEEHLTINIHRGLYRYNRIFRITSSPAIWQRAIDQVLDEVKGTSCVLDNVIITGKDEQEHLDHLEKVLKRLNEHGLRVNREKCELFQEKITYCGHVVDQDGLHKTQEKVDAVVHAPRPEDVRAL